MIRVYDHTGTVIETDARNGELESQGFSSPHFERPVKRVTGGSTFIGSGTPAGYSVFAISLAATAV